MANLSDIVTSKVRVKLLELFFADPKEMFAGYAEALGMDKTAFLIAIGTTETIKAVND